MIFVSNVVQNDGKHEMTTKNQEMTDEITISTMSCALRA